LGYVSRHPLVGSGVGTNTLALNLERGPLWKEVHNAYLECAVELGLPGLVLFLLLMRSCFRRVATVRRASAGHPDLREPFLLAEGIEMSLAAFALAALFHPAAYHLYFYYIAGLAVALDRACARAGGSLWGVCDDAGCAALGGGWGGRFAERRARGVSSWGGCRRARG